MTALRWLFVTFYLAPLVLAVALYFTRSDRADWRSADRSSAGLLPRRYSGAIVSVLSARTVSWRGIFATHSWIVIKDAGKNSYERFDYTAWGQPIWVDRFIPDARWFGSIPDVIFFTDGEEAAAMIPKIRAAIRDYKYSRNGDYRLWPGPNSNTFIAALMQATRMQATLPPTAVGKDYPFDRRWVGRTPSGTGVRFNAAGFFGVSCGWVEGLEIDILGAVAGFDLRHPALKFPALGRVGIPIRYRPQQIDESVS